MSDATNLWTAVLGSNFLNTGLTAFVTSKRSRRKDTGELASDLVKSLMGEVEKLRQEAIEERKSRDRDHRECEEQLKDLRNQIANLIMKLEVLRMRAGVPSAEWLKLEAEFAVTPPDMQAQLDKLK